MQTPDLEKDQICLVTGWGEGFGKGVLILSQKGLFWLIRGSHEEEEGLARRRQGEWRRRHMSQL